jgi:hypothetical protein
LIAEIGTREGTPGLAPHFSPSVFFRGAGEFGEG